MTPWPHQIYGVNEALNAIDAAEPSVCITTPTGGGKTWMMQEICQLALEAGYLVVLYSNRKMLIQQTHEVFNAAKIYHGVRAAGYPDNREHPLQLSSIQTESRRIGKVEGWDLHHARVVIVDEGHLYNNPQAQGVIEQHRKEGATIIYVTATPLGMAEICQRLIVAGRISELRECGALIPARHFGCDEPDLRAFKKLQAKLDNGENPSEEELRKVMGPSPQLFGRVWEWYGKLNPERKPTILFASGVEESIWFAEQFTAKGVRTAHIDGDDVWIDGGFIRSSPDVRKQILADSRTGRIGVVTNRFVLREGIDAPWLAHGILATIFGSLQSYVQSGGRLLRSHPSMSEVTIQDHGGNYWRHGSLNEDREWNLALTAETAYALRAERLRNKKTCRRCKTLLVAGNPWCPKCSLCNEVEPMPCPKCRAVLKWGKCPGCGFDCRGVKRSRPVITTEGVLKEMVGDSFVPRRISGAPNGPQIWERMYHRSRTEKGARSFRAAAALFAYENNWGWPDPSWPLMPIDEMDWFRKVAEVPRERLT